MNGFDPDITSGFGRDPDKGNTIELIDMIFALSNVRLVKEIVQNNIAQIEQLGGISKGQTEGLRSMIMQKQRALFADLTGVETHLQDIVNVSSLSGVEKVKALNKISFTPEQSRALITAVSFAINHMAKFVPGYIGSGLPESMI